MGYFDLSLPYNEPPRSGGKEVAGGKSLRLKLATKAMELGYVGIAHNRSIKGVMSEKDSCTIPLVTLGSLIKVAPRLVSSVGFHRDLLGVPRATPFRQYTRLTVHVDSNAQCQSLNSGNPILKSYDLVAVRPMNQNAFDHACEKAEVDLISIDFTDKMLFRLKHPMVKAAIQRGIYFEIKYSDLLMDTQTRRQVISNVKLLVDWTRGKNLIITSGAPSVTELRGPNDVINLMSLLGLSTERARAAISKNVRNLIAKVLKKKRFHKEAVRVELLSSSDTFSLEKPLSRDCMKWDPLSSGEGDMVLEDLAKAFDAASAVVQKPSKAIDFSSVLNGLPTHGFRVKDIVGTESLTQPPAAVISTNDDDEMKIDSSSECNNDEYMEVTVEDHKHETGDSNINLPNLFTETTDLLRESSKSLSPEAIGQDHDQVSRLESNETMLEEEPSVPYHNTFEITMEENKVEELTVEDKETETETNQQGHVQSSENNNDTKLSKRQAKRSRIRLPQLYPFKPFLPQSSFKRISKRGKHRRV